MSMRLPPQHVASLPTLRSQSWMIIHLENPFTAAPVLVFGRIAREGKRRHHL